MNVKLLTDEERALVALANEGRFEDTSLRKVDEQLAHVNDIEADIIDKYGEKGEDLVKSLGSGTINPNTGLKEYSWLSRRLGSQGAADRHAKGVEAKKMAKEGLQSLWDRAKNDLGEDGKIAEERAGALNTIQMETANASEEASKATEQLISSGGFATSGNASQAMETSLNNQIQTAELKQAEIDREADTAQEGILDGVITQKNAILANYMGVMDKAYRSSPLSGLNAWIEEQRALQESDLEQATTDMAGGGPGQEQTSAA